ncbi:restriction endonuclease [Vibrio coralliilyticus]|uniref:nSTAND3 domain-containing NTPase n=1 Tax=Vibrio coralliilyticus TaxID=190893 RepID=UPI0015612C9D|nr:restriction endonuclease [Vibrio coralliilyticus]NRF64790.1 restriction endonuclease [Vibrio coralliilyticus]
MTYDFKNLSSADFEDLVLDLIGKEEGIRFEAFCAGPDDGIDGRHSYGSENIILQAKHYEGSSFSNLATTMKRERLSIDKLTPSRYILVTSCKLTPANKSKLSSIIGPGLKSEADIFGPEDINGLLRKYPEILKSHIKLWLLGVGVLEQVLLAATHTYTAITLDEIEHKIRVYASNPSFYESLDTLDKYQLLIISGPPGVGKTTLAEILCYTFLSEQWELVPIRSLDDGFAAINNTKKQIFLFDDFLGKVALDRKALAYKDSDLAKFMNRVRRSPNARFILTTRGYIFEEARRVSEHLGDHRLDLMKYVLDVGVYTRQIKARILYNHLLVSDTPQLYIRALVESSMLAKIVDHKNYNPRVIEAMTDILNIGNIDPDNYPMVFIEALNNPSQIWDTAFRTHIDHRCQHLLIAMFFLSEYGVSLAKLRSSFDKLHTTMSRSYSLAHGPKDFEEALRILEGSFVNVINIKGPIISFINPSLKDYLSTYLLDKNLIIRLVPTAASIDWLSNLWDFVRSNVFSIDEQRDVAQACANMLKLIETRPRWRSKPEDPQSLEYVDASKSKRLRLLMDWWQLTNDGRFADSIMVMARNPQLRFSAWGDGKALIELFSDIKASVNGRPFVYEAELLKILEKEILEVICWGSSEILSNLIDVVDSASGLPDSIINAIHKAVLLEFQENDSRIMEDDSESALEERIEELKKLALRFDVSDSELNRAVSAIEERIMEVEEQGSPASTPSFSSPKSREADKFDDLALRDLFMPLLEH